MYCPNCGAQNAETHRFCLKCGASLARPPSDEVPIATIVPAKWPTLQFGKFFAFVQMGFEVLHQQKRIANLDSSPLSVARWSSIWLKPHWELSYAQSNKKFSLAALTGAEYNIEAELFPLDERNQRGVRAFHGLIVDVIFKQRGPSEARFRQADLLTRHIAHSAYQQCEEILLGFETFDGLGRLSEAYSDMLGYFYDHSVEDLRASMAKMQAEQHRMPTSMHELEAYLRATGQID